MKTTRPISTISYNSYGYITLKLKELLKAKKIEFFALICHRGEDDEAGLKDHIHLYIEPSSKIDTVDLCEFFVEPLPGSDKPLKCMPFRNSDFSNWYLYTLHDYEYLRSKGLQKKYQYTDSDYLNNDPDYLRYLVRSIDWLKVVPSRAIQDAVNSGMSREAFVLSGRVPITQTNAYLTVFDAANRVRILERASKGVDENGEFEGGFNNAE